MISIQQKGKDVKIGDEESHKKTTLTIVQEFPKKKVVDNSSPPAGGELVNISRKSEINMPKDNFL